MAELSPVRKKPKKESAFFWDFMQRRMVVCCHRFRTTYWPHLHGPSNLLGCLTLEDGAEKLFRNFGNKLPIYAA
jgi:hypothetical protein